MSYYGTKTLDGGTTLEKRRFGSNNTLRFGNVNFLAAYNPDNLSPLEVTEDSTTLGVDTGMGDCVTVAIGPINPNLTDFKTVDVVDSLTLEPGLNCIVLEGVIKDETGNAFDANVNIPHFVTLSDPVVVTATTNAKLLLFKAV